MSEFSSIHSLAQTITAGTTLFEEGTIGGRFQWPGWGLHPLDGPSERIRDVSGSN